MKFNPNEFKKHFFKCAEDQTIDKIRNAITITYPNKDMKDIEVIVDLGTGNSDGKIKIIGLTEEEVEKALKNF